MRCTLLQAGLADDDLNLADAMILAGVLFGAMLPYMFAALTMVRPNSPTCAPWTHATPPH